MHEEYLPSSRPYKRHRHLKDSKKPKDNRWEESFLLKGNVSSDAESGEIVFDHPLSIDNAPVQLYDFGSAREKDPPPTDARQPSERLCPTPAVPTVNPIVEYLHSETDGSPFNRKPRQRRGTSVLAQAGSWSRRDQLGNRSDGGLYTGVSDTPHVKGPPRSREELKLDQHVGKRDSHERLQEHVHRPIRIEYCQSRSNEMKLRSEQANTDQKRSNPLVRDREGNAAGLPETQITVMDKEEEDALIEHQREERRRRQQEILRRHAQQQAISTAGDDDGHGGRTPEGECSSDISDMGMDGSILDVFGVVEPIPDTRPSALQAVGGAYNVIQTLNAPAVHANAATPVDEDDMFLEHNHFEMSARNDTGQLSQHLSARAAPAGATARLHDSYDDSEGYYNFQLGEVMDGRYEVTEFKGKGVFSTVMRARDLGAVKTPSGGGVQEVAIKVVRANETMSKAAQTEQAILRKLCTSDPENRKHCVRLLRSFEFRNHMCLVFEPMDMNLRDLTKKYGRNKGLNITAVGLYTTQLLIALRHLRKNGVLHADIKPDNILVNSQRTKVKLCDFGSAMLAGDIEVTPYLVSRFYRAPEVILGMKYGEQYCIEVRTNNEMVKLMMDVKGPFTKKMLRRCTFAEKHFDMDEPNMPFVYMEEDSVSKKPVRRMITVNAAKHTFMQLLVPVMRCAKSEDKAQVHVFADLLEKMMTLEPDKRIDVDMALRHPFVRPYLPKKDSHLRDALHL